MRPLAIFQLSFQSRQGITPHRDTDTVRDPPQQLSKPSDAESICVLEFFLVMGPCSLADCFA